MSKFILIFIAILSTTFAYTNGPCSYRSGICIDSGSCSYYGGTVYSGQCPSDPNSIKCCDNIPCRADDGRNGKCVFSSQCNGVSVEENVLEEMISNAALVQEEVLLMEVHLKINTLAHA